MLDIDDPELCSTPFDRHVSGHPAESLQRSTGNTPRQPALWAACEVPDIEPEPCFGRYPKGFLEWALQTIRVRGRDVLHVCTGGMSREQARGGFRFDLRSEAAPDVMADGRALPVLSNSVGAVMLDPPYSVEYAQTLYGVEYPRPSHLLKEAARVVRPGGVVTLLHFLVPVPPPDLSIERVFGVTQGLGYRIRAFTVFRKRERLLFDED